MTGADSSPVFETAAATFRYRADQAAAVDELTMRVPAASFSAVIGPNGSGKSTLLRLLLGLLEPTSGAVRFAGRPVAAWPAPLRAQRIGVVAQSETFSFPITVRELVALGRYPHLGAWRLTRAADAAAVERALDRCELHELAQRDVATLSGGELQRARLARALAQEPETLVLDEPTASLDIAHEMAFFELLAALRRAAGVTVLLVTHNLNLAARYAGRLLLLERGRTAAEGAPAEVLTAANIQRVYGWPVAVHAHAGPGPDAGAPQIVPLAGHTDPLTASRSTTTERTAAPHNDEEQ